MSFSTLHEKNRNDTHDMRPSAMLACSCTGFPDSSKGGAMSNVESTEQTMAHSERVAMYCPGQILSMPLVSSSVDIVRERHHLRPYPKAAWGSLTSGFGLPSLRNLSGRNSSGSGYITGSCKMVLRTYVQQCHWVKHYKAYQAFPITRVPFGKK